MALVEVTVKTNVSHRGTAYLPGAAATVDADTARRWVRSGIAETSADLTPPPVPNPEADALRAELEALKARQAPEGVRLPENARDRLVAVKGVSDKLADAILTALLAP